MPSGMRIITSWSNRTMIVTVTAVTTKRSRLPSGFNEFPDIIRYNRLWLYWVKEQNEQRSFSLFLLVLLFLSPFTIRSFGRRRRRRTSPRSVDHFPNRRAPQPAPG